MLEAHCVANIFFHDSFLLLSLSETRVPLTQAVSHLDSGCNGVVEGA